MHSQVVLLIRLDYQHDQEVKQLPRPNGSAGCRLPLRYVDGHPKPRTDVRSGTAAVWRGAPFEGRRTEEPLAESLPAQQPGGRTSADLASVQKAVGHLGDFRVAGRENAEQPRADIEHDG